MYQKASKPLIWVCFALPAFVMACAYAYLSVRHNTLWVFDTVVHENGRYTLLETIFYFGHFMWEVPIKALYALFLVGLFYWLGPTRKDQTDPPVAPVSAGAVRFSLGVVVAMLLVSFAAAAYAVGLKETLIGFLQYRTSELRPVQFGSHWHNHFLSNIVLFTTSALFVQLYRQDMGNRGRFSSFFYAGSAAFVVLTVIFGVSGDPFMEPSVILHQTREILGSDLPVTLPLSVGTRLFLERKYSPGIVGTKGSRGHGAGYHARLFAWGIPAGAITLFLTLRTLGLKAAGEIDRIAGAASENYVFDYFAWHVFEHTLDYVFVVSLVSALYLITIRLRSVSQNEKTSWN